MIRLMLLPALGMLALIIAQSARADTPPVHREQIEWCDIWIADGGGTKLPRVLLIGDSISRAYYPDVQKDLAGKASVSRLSTSASIADPSLLESLALVLKVYKFDVIHFNNGLHGWDYTEDDYQKYLPEMIATIRKYQPNAKLVWATTTPERLKGALDQFDPRNDRVKERNRRAAEVVASQSIPTDDLYSVMDGHPEFYVADGVHPNANGAKAEADSVTASVTALLPATQ